MSRFKCEVENKTAYVKKNVPRKCLSKARFKVTLQDGRTLLVCGRHANSIAVANLNGKVKFEELT